MKGAPLEPFVGDFATGDDYLKVWDGVKYNRIFLKGANLGLAMPGATLFDFAVKYSDYVRWLNKMGELGFNVVRVYRLHPPAFYDALAAYNCLHQQNPIYVIQGTVLKDPEDLESEEKSDLYHLTPEFEAEIEETIDAVHGARKIDRRSHAAYGEYKTDVSHWVVGILIGREVVAQEVLSTDKRHPGDQSFQGSALSLAGGNPTSVWVTARLDHTIAYERTRYGVNRPVGFSNWLQTDPLRHPTERSSSHQDVATIDTSRVVAFGAPTGVFASFHVYPYYPDFISEDPGYRSYPRDEWGEDSYGGYLHELKAYHGKMPVIVGEFGVPSSWGIGHYSSNGMHHGGHTDEMQANYGKRMVRDIAAERFAGAIAFEWMDEWFKTVWITRVLAFPDEHLPRWHDLTNPQQFYGLLAFDVGAPDYTKLAATSGSGRVSKVEAAVDPEFFHVRLSLTSPLADGETVTIGYDTYRDDLGETLLPDGTRTKQRSEFALTVTAPSVANLQVMKSYDLYDLRDNMTPSYSILQSSVSDAGAWVEIRRNTVKPHQSDDKKYMFPGRDQPIGQLVARRSSAPGSNLDAVVISETTVEVRIPWSLLQFTNPTRLSVMHDDRRTPEHEVLKSDGIRLAVSIGGQVVETQRLAWSPWASKIKWTERYRPLAAGLAEAFAKVAPLPPSP